MADAWYCPNCEAHHAPHVDTCPNKKTNEDKKEVERLLIDDLNKFPKTTRPWKDLIPAIDLMNSRCGVCGMTFSGATGYCCPNINCPSRVTY